MAVTKADVLSGFPELKVCTHYELDGKKIEIAEGQYENLEFRKGQDPYEVALAFVKKHGMEESAADTICDTIEQELGIE